jgi:adenylate cyclase
MAISLTTRRPEGFAERDIAAFESLLPAFAALIELIETRRTARLLLDTYVGPDAGSQVLAGDIQRGQGHAIEAVVWFSDIRGFSQLSNTLPSSEVIELLNAYFDVMAEPIKARGGEILKFLGDGLLAIFPVETISAQTCRNAGAGALAAAEAALVGLDALNTTRRAVGQAEIQTGIALHIGEMMYGNVGSADRLDFTVIGAAVNLVVRLEGLTRGLEPPIVCSAPLAELCGRPLRSLGLHELKGFAEPQEAFAPCA